MFGSFELRVNGVIVENQTWQRRKNKHLFQYFILHRGRPLSPRLLIETLFDSDADPRSLTNLRGRISQVRRILEPSLKQGHDSSYIVTGADGAYLFPNHATCSVDLDAFLVATKEGEAHFASEEWDKAASAFERAAATYRGDLLADEMYEEWTHAPRHAFQDQFLHVLDRLGTSLIETGRYRDAVAAYDRMLREDPYAETAYRGKMMALAYDGNEREALKAYETCHAALGEDGMSPETETDELRDAILRGEVRPERSSRLSGTPPPVIHVPSRSANLPRWQTSFFGRTAELRAIREALVDPDIRFITLLGHGGIGKSRLSIEAVMDCEAELPGPVYFVHFSSAGSRGQFLSSLADEIGLQLSGERDALNQVIAALRGRRFTIILDNAEYAGDESVRQCEAILAATPAKFLASSRERLHAEGELIIELSGLAHMPASGGRPENGSIAFPVQTIDLNEILELEAVQLFVDRISRANRNFTLDADTAPDVLRVCRLTGGMPLALELAAKWGDTLSCAEIADRIQSNLHFLELRAEEFPSAHQSVDAIFEHTWARLSEQEQRVFARLSIFHSGMSLHAAQTIAQAAASDLISLRDRGLLQRTSAGRIVMHELVRQFAERKLVATPDDHMRTLEAFAQYYHDRLMQFGPQLHSNNQVFALSQLQTDADNYLTLWQMYTDQMDVGRLAAVLSDFYYMHELRTRWRELRLAFAPTIERVEQAIALTAPLEPEADDLDTISVQQLKRLLGAILFRYGTASHHLGDFRTARAAIARCMEIAVATDSPTLRAESLMLSGLTLESEGKLDEAETEFLEALDIMRRFGTEQEIAKALSRLGTVYRIKRDLDRSEEIYLEMLEFHRATGNPTEMAGTLLNLGTVQGSRRRFEESERLFEESLKIARQVGHQHLIIMNTGNIGMLAFSRMDMPKARDMLLQSLAIAEKLGIREGLMISTYHLALVVADLGEFDGAVQYLKQARALATELQIDAHILRCVFAYGHLLRCRGEYEEAFAVITFAIDHPATQPPIKVYARDDLDTLRTHLSEAQIEAATQKAATFTVDGLLQRIDQVCVNQRT